MLTDAGTEFQRLYTPNAFRQERILWKAVIQLNIVRSIRMILDAISTTMRYASSHYPNSLASTSRPRPRRITLQDIDTRAHLPLHSVRHQRQLSHTHMHRPSINESGNPSSSSRRLEDFASPGSDYHSQYDYQALSELTHELGVERSEQPRQTSLYISSEIDAVAKRLVPVRHIESLLIAKLVPPNEDEPAHMGMSADGQGTEIGSSWRRNEVFVRPGTGWKGILARAMRMQRPQADPAVNEDGSPSEPPELHDEAQEVLNACKHDMMKLWYDPGVREVLRRKKIRLEELPGL